NTVFRTAYRNPYGGSGLNIFHSHDVDSNSQNKNFVVGNLAYDNRQDVNSTAIGFNEKTDGNGIIIDSNTATNYGGGTVVALNLAFRNGGRGVEAFQSRNVLIQDNNA